MQVRWKIGQPLQPARGWTEERRNLSEVVKPWEEELAQSWRELMECRWGRGCNPSSPQHTPPSWGQMAAGGSRAGWELRWKVRLGPWTGRETPANVWAALQGRRASHRIINFLNGKTEFSETSNSSPKSTTPVIQLGLSGPRFEILDVEL